MVVHETDDTSSTGFAMDGSSESKVPPDEDKQEWYVVTLCHRVISSLFIDLMIRPWVKG